MKRLLVIALLLGGCEAVLDFDKLRHGSDDMHVGGDGGAPDGGVPDAAAHSDGGAEGCTPSASGPNFDYSDDAGAGGLFVPTSYASAALAVADVDGDHRLDLLLVGNDQTLYLWQQSEARTFTQTVVTTSVCQNGESNAILAADFDGDGRTDLVVGCDDSSESVQELYFFRGVAGNPFFAQPTSFAHPPTNPALAAAGDVDGDGLIDAVVADSSASGVSIYWGDDTGQFSMKTPTQAAIPGSDTLGGISVAPMGATGDSTLDIVVNTYTANPPGGLIAVLRRDRTPGSRTFVAPSDADLIQVNGSETIRTAVGDLNGDGRPDLVAAESDSSVHYGNGMPSSTGATQFVVPANSVMVAVFPRDLAIGDLNCDGRADVVLTHAALIGDDADIYEVMKASTSGALSVVGGENDEANDQPATDVVKLADLDGDGYADLVMTLLGTDGAGDFRVVWGRP